MEFCFVRFYFLCEQVELLLTATKPAAVKISPSEKEGMNRFSKGDVAC